MGVPSPQPSRCGFEDPGLLQAPWRGTCVGGGHVAAAQGVWAWLPGADLILPGLAERLRLRRLTWVIAAPGNP